MESEKKKATFRREVPGKPDDPVIDSVSLDLDRAVGLRINEDGVGLLSFMRLFIPKKEMKDGKLVPSATARFNGEDHTHTLTEICVSPEGLRALKVLLDRHIKPVDATLAPMKPVPERPSPLGL